MEHQAFSRYATRSSTNPELRLFSGRKDQDVIEITPSTVSHRSSAQKRKQNQVVPYDVIEIDGDEDPSGVVIIGNEDGVNGKKKTTGHSKNKQKQIKDAFSQNVVGYPNDSLATSASWNPHESSGLESQNLKHSSKNVYPNHSLATSTSWNPHQKSSGLESQNLNYSNKFNFDFMDIDDAIRFSLAPQFAPNQPPWEEVDLDIDDAISFSLATQFAPNQPPWVEPSIPPLQEPAYRESSSMLPSQSSSCKQQKGNEDEIAKKLKLFKQFDTVHDHSDHWYNHPHNKTRGSFHGVSLTKKAPIQWSKKVQQEWKILREDLPDSIFVRVYEERIDLLRAVIIGAAGTPYHDGLFFFDIFFPSSYPSQPPLVYYYSGGLRLNPNLYQCGKVCLSLLNTWTGSTSEQWTPGKSTILQVLLSIQALVLNAKPFFNEPGYVRMSGTPEGEKQSLAYNEQAFLLSCRTMLYTLQKPLKNFEDLVAGHFCQRAHSILEACKAYMDGAQVGCLVGGGVQDVDEGDKSCSADFRVQLGQLYPNLLQAFTNIGADCTRFSINQANETDTTTEQWISN